MLSIGVAPSERDDLCPIFAFRPEVVSVVVSVREGSGVGSEVLRGIRLRLVSRQSFQYIICPLSPPMVRLVADVDIS